MTCPLHPRLQALRAHVHPIKHYKTSTDTHSFTPCTAPLFASTALYTTNVHPIAPFATTDVHPIAPFATTYVHPIALFATADVHPIALFQSCTQSHGSTPCP